MSDAVEHFEIEVPADEITDLQARLRATRWPAEAPLTDWRYGTDLAYLQELCGSWADEYDWRTHEARLSSLAVQNFVGRVFPFGPLFEGYLTGSRLDVGDELVEGNGEADD